MRRRFLLLAILALPFGQALALYDPAPDAALAGVQGEWHGTLTYRDYSNPDRLVTLPTRLFVALGGPDELVLHFVFDDGPAKTVHSYERMKFDVKAGRIAWASGTAGEPAVTHQVMADSVVGDVREVTFERVDAHGRARFVLRLSPTALSLAKDELASTGEATFRNRYEFSRRGT